MDYAIIIIGADERNIIIDELTNECWANRWIRNEVAVNMAVFMVDCLSCGACFLAIGATPNESDCGDATSLSERMLLISPESGLSHA